MSHISLSKPRRVKGAAGQRDSQAYRIRTLVDSFGLHSVLPTEGSIWIPGMKTENSFASNYKRTPIIDMSGGGTDQLCVPLNTVDIRQNCAEKGDFIDSEIWISSWNSPLWMEGIFWQICSVTASFGH